MSFKREGDDYSALNILKKRRVAELLANDIPDDEAILMANGRYACTVCSYRPVFDTVDMLTVHRKGKKHATYLQRHYRKQREITELKIKRIQNEYLKREESRSKGKDSMNQTAPLLAETQRITQNALRKAVPYNSCVKWGRSKIASDGGQSSGPTKKLFFQSSKPSSKSRTSFGGVAGAYVPKRIRNKSHNTAALSTELTTCSTREGDEDNISKTVLNIQQNSFLSQGEITSLMLSAPPPPPPPLPLNNETSHTSLSSVAMATSDSQSEESPANSHVSGEESQTPEHLNNDKNYDQDDDVNLNTEANDERQRRKAEVQYYVKMKSDGWIKDYRTGKWLRDENVEFDSDDEPPSPQP